MNNLKRLYTKHTKRLTVPGEAAGAAALERGVLLVALQQLRASPLGLLHVDKDAREAADPAVLIIRGRRAPGRLGATHQTEQCQHAARYLHDHVDLLKPCRITVGAAGSHVGGGM